MKTKNAFAASVSVLALLASTVAGLGPDHGCARRSRQGRRPADRHRPAPRLVRLARVIDAFKAKYPGITVNELNPDAGSADEIEAISANKGNTGPQAPDVIDVGLSFGPSAKAEGLIQPYKVSTWDLIPG